MRALVVGLLLVGTATEAAAATRAQVARAVAAGPAQRLSKLALRPTLKRVMPRLQRCYARARKRDRAIEGVVNTKLTVRNAPGLGMTFEVTGFETHGPLGESKPFLACVTRTLEAEVLPPLATLGRAELVYPLTFAATAPSARDRALVDDVERAAAAGDWTGALAGAASALEHTSLDGPLRRRLIELGGVAACHLGDVAQARRYYALASPAYEASLEAACAARSIQLALEP